MVSPQVLWAQRQGRLRREMAITEWKIEPGGRFIQWKKGRNSGNTGGVNPGSRNAATAGGDSTVAGRGRSTVITGGDNIETASRPALRQLSGNEVYTRTEGSLIEEAIERWPNRIGSRSSCFQELKLKILDAGMYLTERNDYNNTNNK